MEKDGREKDKGLKKEIWRLVAISYFQSYLSVSSMRNEKAAK